MEGGRPLPEFKKIAPLTPEDELLLIGGEACMWTEMANGFTIESRIWPRATVIGEKLWSPKVLTDDVPDMYRRLMAMDDHLETIGLKHRSYSRILTDQIVDEELQDPLHTLVQVLQEDRLFNRMSIYDQKYSVLTPLNRVVDAALSESLVAYRFSQDVDLWIESGDGEASNRLHALMETWSGNHEKLASEFDINWKLKEVEAHSIYLSELAILGLQAMSDPATLEGMEAEMETLFSSASAAYGGTIMLLVEPVQKLVESAMKN
jgi:hexosaminidase